MLKALLPSDPALFCHQIEKVYSPPDSYTSSPTSYLNVSAWLEQSDMTYYSTAANNTNITLESCSL